MFTVLLGETENRRVNYGKKQPEINAEIIAIEKLLCNIIKLFTISFGS
jgi:hypothetical protein